MKKKIKKIRWTEEEERELLETISDYAGNLKEAFRIFCDEHPDRTIAAVNFKWYGDLKKQNNVRTCLITIDRKHKHVNTKNVRTFDSSSKIERTIWSKIKSLLHLN